MDGIYQLRIIFGQANKVLHMGLIFHVFFNAVNNTKKGVWQNENDKRYLKNRNHI